MTTKPQPGEEREGLERENPAVELRRTIKDLHALGNGMLARRLERVEAALSVARTAALAQLLAEQGEGGRE